MKLCLVDENWAYFTDQPITGEGRQWGDDWGDAPYEHNAGLPYASDGENVIKCAWEGEFVTPSGESSNSEYSVDRINQGVIPWLVTSRWYEGDTVVIPAGVSPFEFTALITNGGGRTYWSP
jgi:hypothetical protein